MSKRTYTWNAYETKLAGPLLALATSVAVESTAGLEDPTYLVVDPDVPAKREWIRVGTISPGLLENIVRNQEGSVGNIDHDTGALVRAVFTKQLQDDLFDDVESIEKSIQDHVNVQIQPDPHPQYLLEGAAETTYVPLAGTQAQLPMTGPLMLFGPPTQDLHAATKAYADTAGDGVFLPLTGGIMTGVLNANGGLALSAGAIDDTNASHWGVLWNDVSGRLERSTNKFLPLSGGTLTGRLHINSGMDVNSWGIEYPGADVGGGGANAIGFRWGSNRFHAVVDNAISQELAHTGDLAVLEDRIATLETRIETLEQ